MSISCWLNPQSILGTMVDGGCWVALGYWSYWVVGSSSRTSAWVRIDFTWRSSRRSRWSERLHWTWEFLLSLERLSRASLLFAATETGNWITPRAHVLKHAWHMLTSYFDLRSWTPVFKLWVWQSLRYFFDKKVPRISPDGGEISSPVISQFRLTWSRNSSRSFGISQSESNMAGKPPN